MDFDGLRSILGNADVSLYRGHAAVALDAVETGADAGEALEDASRSADCDDMDSWLTLQPAPAVTTTVQVEDPISELPRVVSDPTQGVALRSVEPTLEQADEPTLEQAVEPMLEQADELLELDRGVYDAQNGRAAAPSVQTNSDELFELDRGVYDPGHLVEVSRQYVPLANRLVLPAARELAQPQPQAQASAQPERARPPVGSGWLAVAVVLAGMVFGACAALVVFHQQVGQIVAQWATPPGPSVSQVAGSHGSQKGSF